MKEMPRLPAAMPTLHALMPTLDFNSDEVIPEITFSPETMAPMVILEEQEELERIRTLTPFKHFRVHNLIEIGPIYEPWTTANYHTVLGHAHLYLGKNKIPASQMTVTIICRREPRKVLHHYKPVVQFERIEKGHYQSTGEPLVHIIVISALEYAEQNYYENLIRVISYKFVHFVYNTLIQSHLDSVHHAEANPRPSPTSFTCPVRTTPRC